MSGQPPGAGRTGAVDGSVLLGGALAAAGALAALVTLTVPRLLSGPPAMNGSARGTALVVLVGGVTSLVVGLRGALHGQLRSLVIAGGAAAYLLYNAFMFLFATPFNRAFLVYDAMFAFAFWFLLVTCLRLWAVGGRLHPPPLRPVAVFIWAVVTLNALAWLAKILPATTTSRPRSVLVGTGLTTNPVYVQDLAVWLPALAWLGVGVWRAHGPRVVLAGAALWFWVLEAAGVAVDQAWGHHADPASGVASLAVVPVFACLALLTLWPLVRTLRTIPTSFTDATTAPAYVEGAVTNGRSGQASRH